MKKEKVKTHFTDRAEKFNNSANWVNDPELLDKMFQLAKPDKSTVALDIATGTGRVAKRFHGKVKQLYGIDICPDMVAQNKYIDELVIAPAEKMPFKNDKFDLVFCRQGFQFMELLNVVTEVFRVLKPGGRLVIAHLTSYSEADKDETFSSLALRNAARKHFFTSTDIPNILMTCKFHLAEIFNYGSRESVFDWLNHGAMSLDDVDKAMNFYRNASLTFKQLHKVEISGEKIEETMNMQIIKAVKPIL